MNGSISGKTILFIGFRGAPTFSRGRGPIFSMGEVQMLNSLETHVNWDFLGSLDPYPPSETTHEVKS